MLNNKTSENNTNWSIFRVHTTSPCIQMFYDINGKLGFPGDGSCKGKPAARTWFNLKIAVDHVSKVLQI